MGNRRTGDRIMELRQETLDLFTTLWGRDIECEDWLVSMSQDYADSQDVFHMESQQEEICQSQTRNNLQRN
jgi:hypothetical protein